MGPSSFILLQWKDESVDACDRLKAQICQCEEILCEGVFREKIRLVHRIQKDQASHRVMWEASLTLTQARGIFSNPVKCKYILQLNANLGLRQQKQLLQVTSLKKRKDKTKKPSELKDAEN